MNYWLSFFILLFVEASFGVSINIDMIALALVIAYIADRKRT